MALLSWLNGSRDHAAYPKSQEKDENNASAFVVGLDGVARSWGKTPHPQVLECSLYAMGHGRDFALAAMHCGKSAREAVELTCKLDVYCGNGVDTLELQAGA